MTILSNREITQIWKGSDEIVSGSLKLLESAQSTLDLCTDSTGPYWIASQAPFRTAYFSLEEKSVKIRVITEITRDNLPWARDLMKVAELRHLDGIVGSFAIADHSDYAGSSAAEVGARRFDRLVATNVGSFVRLQEYLFDSLWSSSIPAEDMILGIEKGTKSGVIELIPNTQDSIAKAFELMRRTEKELLVQFASFRTFALAMTMGTAKLYDEMTQRGVNVSILVPGDGKDSPEGDSVVMQVKKVAPHILIKVSDERMKTMISIMICDRKEVMSWELKDDTLSDPYAAGGIATYSSIESIASSYAIIFDNLWAISDITENLRTANVKLEMNEEAMKEFMDIASHELRTPLQPILGLSQLLRDSGQQAGARSAESARSLEGSDTVPPHAIDQSYAIEVITRNAQRLQKLAEDILDVTRIESGRLRLYKANLDVCELVESTVAEYSRAMEETGKNKANLIKLVVFPSASRKATGGEPSKHLEPHYYVKADRDRLSRVILNLLSNATTFGKRKAISVKIKIGSPLVGVDIAVRGKVKSSAPLGGSVEISVSDEGPGISVDVFPRLFDKFVSKSPRGSGLGLYISKKIVEAHGGRIWAANNRGRGATFTFSLPLVSPLA